MANRTSPKEVRGILGQHFQSDEVDSLLPFIAAAKQLVDRVAKVDTTTLLDSADLANIETWLSAHFYAHADQLPQSSGEGGANATHQGQTGMALGSTQYGQTAMVLDFTGELARLSGQAADGKSRRASVTWLGKKKSQQIPYVNRD